MNPSPELHLELNTQNLTEARWLSPASHDLPVLNVAQIRQVEQAAFRRVDSFLLMQAAGLRSARKIGDWVDHFGARVNRVVVLAGIGNNGGDACVVAAELAQRGLQVEVWQLPNAKPGSDDRMKALTLCLASAATFRQWGYEALALTPGCLVVDGLLGIACETAPKEPLASWIGQVNAEVHKVRQAGGQISVIALDCPSGLNCNTGQAPGAAIEADLTLSYIACKTGLLTDSGKDLCGELLIESLGCDALIKQLEQETLLGHVLHTASKARQIARMPNRRHAHHKGSFGSLGILGGQAGMVGACVLSARAALLLGAGRVAISLLMENTSMRSTPFLDSLFPEMMNKHLDENLEFCDVLIAGPGLGQSPEAQESLFQILAHPKGHHMVWDADALNLLAKSEDKGETDPEQPVLEVALQQYKAQYPDHALVFTPHPLEAARLLNCSTQDVQENRLKAALAISARFNCTVVLKGAGTVIANHAGSQTEINCTGGPALGTAGSGDVLAGAIGSMLAQGLSEFEASAFAVWLHGLAIDPIGFEKEGLMISHASEIGLRMKQHLNHLLNNRFKR